MRGVMDRCPVRKGFRVGTSDLDALLIGLLVERGHWVNDVCEHRLRNLERGQERKEKQARINQSDGRGGEEAARRTRH